MSAFLLKLGIFLGFSFSHLPAFAQSAAELQPSKSLSELLADEVPENFTDSNSVRHRLYFSNSHQKFLRLIEKSVEDFSSTSVGKSLFQYVLGCNSSAISQHLGVSHQKANELASQCFRESSFAHVNSLVLESQNGSPETKLTMVPGSQKRQYVLVISDRLDWSVDSWTDPFSNKTILVIGREIADQGHSLAFFYQLMAHELAIYFDTKAWVGSTEWNEVDSYAAWLEAFGDNRQELTIALNNPLISQILRSLRAFKVEKILIEELVANGTLPIQVLSDYQTDLYEFLRPDCEDSCIFNFVRTHAPLLLAQSLPLLSFSPQYRNQKTLQILGRSYFSPVDQELTRILQNYSDRYLREIFQSDLFFNMVAPQVTPDQRILFTQTQEAFEDHFLPEDLSVISRSMQLPLREGVGFLTFLATPQLGGKNVRLSGGPRPRIRSGGTPSVILEN